MADKLQDKPEWDSYKTGGTSSKGIEILEIIGCNSACIVFISKSGGVQWEHDLDLNNCASATNEASKVLNQIYSTLDGKGRKYAAYPSPNC